MFNSVRPAAKYEPDLKVLKQYSNHTVLLLQLFKNIGRLKPWGPLPVETRGTGPPKFSFGGANNGLAPPPQILEVYNNSNLVNNEVFKKLTTKLASMKYHITETLSDITC